MVLKAIRVSQEWTNSNSSSASPTISSNKVPLEIKSLHRRLQNRNDMLQNLLSPSRRSRMEELWPHRNPPDDDSEPIPIIAANAVQHSRPNPRPTAAEKYIGQLIKQRRGGNNKGLLPGNTIDITRDFCEHSLGSYHPQDDTPGSLVLVEWKKYSSDWTSSKGKELYNRVGEIAELLHDPGKYGRDWLHVLNCRGWLHDVTENRFGFVYGIPENPESLYTLISESKTMLGGPPPLGMKFRLAARIARCLRDVHGIGWLHKNISAHNVIFSPSQGAMVSTTSAYLVGFQHSRIDDEKAFTEGPNILGKNIEYQHPEYRALGKGEKTRFHRTYDYYSLGLVLLEIGFWKPYNSIANSKKTLSPVQLRQYLIEDLTPRLDGYIGTVYRNVVLACLEGDFGSSCTDETDEGRETLAQFTLKVVQPLSTCFA